MNAARPSSIEGRHVTTNVARAVVPFFVGRVGLKVRMKRDLTEHPVSSRGIREAVKFNRIAVDGGTRRRTEDPTKDRCSWLSQSVTEARFQGSPAGTSVEQVIATPGVHVVRVGRPPSGLVGSRCRRPVWRPAGVNLVARRQGRARDQKRNSYEAEQRATVSQTGRTEDSHVFDEPQSDGGSPPQLPQPRIDRGGPEDGPNDSAPRPNGDGPQSYTDPSRRILGTQGVLIGRPRQAADAGKIRSISLWAKLRPSRSKRQVLDLSPGSRGTRTPTASTT